jgi:hypothetical protein
MSLTLYMLIPIVFGLFAILFGGVFLFNGLRGRQQSDASRGWPTAPGRVTAAVMHTRTNFSSDGAPTVSYQPVVDYDYAVIGAPYHASRIAFGADSFGRRQAEAVLAKYPPGSAVRVYYNPEKPDEAVLEQSAKGTLVFMIVGGLFTLIGLCVICVGLGVIVLAANSMN